MATVGDGIAAKTFLSLSTTTPTMMSAPGRARASDPRDCSGKRGPGRASSGVTLAEDIGARRRRDTDFHRGRLSPSREDPLPPRARFMYHHSVSSRARTVALKQGDMEPHSVTAAGLLGGYDPGRVLRRDISPPAASHGRTVCPFFDELAQMGPSQFEECRRLAKSGVLSSGHHLHRLHRGPRRPDRRTRRATRRRAGLNVMPWFGQTAVACCIPFAGGVRKSSIHSP